MTKRRALILGASAGVGAYFATRLTAEDWAVTGLGRRPREEASLPAGTEYIQADLSLPETLEWLSGKVGDTPDLIVYSAVRYPDTSAGAPALDDMEAIFRVNALIPYRLLLDLLTRPREKFCACIVVNSDAMYHAREQSGLYSASKAALRVLTGALADACRDRNTSVSTLVLGTLADPVKVDRLRRIAAQRDRAEADVTRAFLRRMNPNLVIDTLIDFESCYRSLLYMAELGPIANGMMCRLDGGSSGGLI